MPLLALFGSSEPITQALTLDAVWVAALIGTIIPILTGIVTKLKAKPVVKQAVALVLSGVGGLITAGLTVDGSATITKAAFLSAGLIWLQQMAVFLGILKPNDIGEKLFPDKGLGKPEL